MKSEHYKRVEEFMKLAGQETITSPQIPDWEVRFLRAKLILEEALETIEALGFCVEVYSCDDESIALGMDNVDFADIGKVDLVQIADGCADLSVVTVGTLIACGVPDVELLQLVDENNLAKFGEGGYKDEVGKWRKPPGHKPPDIKGLLERLQ